MVNKRWTQEDYDTLQDMWGDYSIPTIAAKLDRSVNAVKIKAGKMGLGRHLHGGTYVTFCELLKAIGQYRNYSYMKIRLQREGFPFKKKKVVKCRFLMVDIDDFWKWTEKHRDAIDFSDFEEYALGVEPEWAKEKRKADVAARFNRKPWTKAEDARLVKLLDTQRFTYDGLCRELNRSEGAIKRRMTDLGIKMRPVRRVDRFWTADETKKLLEMRIAGYCFEDIGRELGRSGSAVRGKFERLQNPEYCKRYNRRQRENMSEFFQKDQCRNYVKTIGCTAGGTNCDECLCFSRRVSGEKASTGWVSLSSKAPRELLGNLVNR